MHTEDLADKLEWARYVRDRSALASNDKRTIKRALEDYLAALTARYIVNPALVFPSNEEHSLLHDMCLALAQLAGKTKFEFGQYSSAIKRVENRYSKLAIFGFFDGLLSKFDKLEVPPRTVIFNALSSAGSDDVTLRTLQGIYGVLGSEDWRPSISSHPWGEWLDAIHKFQSLVDPVCLQLTRLFEANQGTGHGSKLLQGYFVFMDLIRRQLLWDRKYGRSIRPTVTWIYSLQRPGDIERLRRIVHGTAPTPEQMRVSIGVSKNQVRRNRHYLRHRRVRLVQ